MIPFVLRRATLLTRFAMADRDRPDLDAMARITDPEEFVFAILPHAARTFAACIALMPRRTVLPSAVAYLYCRMLDTYEDLVPDRHTRESALRAFADRLSTSAERLGLARPIDAATVQDERDRAHLLLVRKAGLVDELFLTFDVETRGIIRDLVVDMADGMCWASATFDRQGGVLLDDGQLATYCRHVLGNPTVFGVRILRLNYGRPATLTPDEREDAMLVGEFVQLANVTRDIEKDLRRGIAYDPSLKADLGRDASRHAERVDRALVERCREVRARLISLAVARAPAYRRTIDVIRMPSLSIARAAALLMLLFTERYYLGAADSAPVLAEGLVPPTTADLLVRSVAAAFSPTYGEREMRRAERALSAVG